MGKLQFSGVAISGLPSVLFYSMLAEFMFSGVHNILVCSFL